ncbi:hypothetical protein ABIB25_004839 [Nakamurella sp. UYEF19]
MPESHLTSRSAKDSHMPFPPGTDRGRLIAGPAGEHFVTFCHRAQPANYARHGSAKRPGTEHFSCVAGHPEQRGTYDRGLGTARRGRPSAVTYGLVCPIDELSFEWSSHHPLEVFPLGGHPSPLRRRSAWLDGRIGLLREGVRAGRSTSGGFLRNRVYIGQMDRQSGTSTRPRMGGRGAPSGFLVPRTKNTTCAMALVTAGRPFSPSRSDRRWSPSRRRARPPDPC